MKTSIVVFSDIKDDGLLEETIESATDGSVVRIENSLINELYLYEKRTPLRAGVFACFITKKTLKDADVVFAAYSKRILVLSLTTGGQATGLLHTVPSPVDQNGADVSAARSKAVMEFLGNKSHKGRIIVFEGGDGAGKATQTGLMLRRLKEKGELHATLDFPSDSHRYGRLIRKLLSGSKGGLRELDPKLFSLLFSLNRFHCLPELRYWLRRGMNIVLDRYYTANFGHQASKVVESERANFIDHLETLEVDWLQLPPPDVVVYLDLPPEAAFAAMRGDAARRSLDIHEMACRSYKESVNAVYRWCCKHKDGWIPIECCSEGGTRYNPEETHKLVCEAVERHISQG